mgnify:CR=1 FL=1
MIVYGKEFFKKSFTADDMKSAYMSAVKWYSTNVLSKAEFSNVQVQFIKDTERELPTITIRLFAIQDGEKDVMDQHCKCCKEMHHSFFINEDTNCNRCSALGFQNRLEQKINIKGE